MNVTVRLFATLRQQAGWASQTVALPEDATVKVLIGLLDEQNAGLNIANRSVYAAVNQSYTQVDVVLHEGDEVAFFPPVSGG